MVLLLHGFCESPAIFDGLIPALADRYRVVCPVLPGHAGLAWDDTLATISDLADWLKRFLDSLEVESCYLVGHSLGGYIAAAMAERHPGRLTGVCMLHSTALEDPAVRQENRNKSLAFIGRFGTKPFLKAFVDSLFYESPEASGMGRLQEWKAELAAITSQVDPEAIMALTMAMRDRPSRLREVQASGVPFTYVIGEHDSLVTAERSAMEFQDWEDAKVIHLQGVGHMAMYEAREELIQVLLQILPKKDQISTQ